MEKKLMGKNVTPLTSYSFLKFIYLHFICQFFQIYLNQCCSVNFSQAVNGDHDALFTCTECVIIGLCFEIHPNQSS